MSTEREYLNYEIRVVPAESWMDRPIRVELVTPSPTGGVTQTIYLDFEERDELIRLLSEVS